MSYTDGLDNPELHFQSKLYAGNSTTRSITFDGSENMQPDWVWIKERDDAINHYGYDSVRGVDKRETYLDYVEEMKSSSLDFYATMRSLYRQKRKKDISGEFENEKVSLDLLPVDVYDDSELIEEVEKIVSTSMDNKTIVSSPSSYKGSLPSSNYPDYNEFPVSYTN